MPKLFKIGSFNVYFWSKEDNEPIHVHVCIGNPFANATKFWLTESGGCIVAHNKGRISQSDLTEILEMIQANYDLICLKWKEFFDINDIKFYC